MPFQLSPGSILIQDVERNCLVTYHRNYLGESQANVLLARMLNAPWETETPIVFGKPRTVKRKTCAFGAEGLTYGYSGMTKTARPWIEGGGSIIDIRFQLHQDTSWFYNFVLCNLYPDGEAAIGAHADDEEDIEPGSPIVGVSLGASRDFILTDKATGERVTSVELEHGSALVMWEDTQKHYKHALPARKRVKEPRVSLTFRVMGL